MSGKNYARNTRKISKLVGDYVVTILSSLSKVRIDRNMANLHDYGAYDCFAR